MVRGNVRITIFSVAIKEVHEVRTTVRLSYIEIFTTLHMRLLLPDCKEISSIKSTSLHIIPNSELPS